MTLRHLVPLHLPGRPIQRRPLLFWSVLLWACAVAQPAVIQAQQSPIPTSWPQTALIENKDAGPKHSSDLLGNPGMPVPDPRQLDFDVQHYSLEFRIDPFNGWLSGSVTVTFSTVNGPLTELVLDFRDNMHCTKVSLPNDALHPLPFTRGNDLLIISLPAVSQPGDFGVVTISFWGQPQAEGLFGYQVNTSHGGRPIAATVSEPWSARSWWPCKDEPTDKATVNVSIAVPPGFAGISNGVLTNQTDDIWAWSEAQPISTYLVSLAVAQYTEIADKYSGPAGTIRLRHYVFPEDAAKARQDMSPLPAMLDFCGELFGPYPFTDQPLGIAECVWDQAMEHPTTITYGNVLLPGTNQFDTVLVHELAHMWFGDMVTPTDWTEIWLSEGFATYVEALWAEHQFGATGLRNFMVSHNWGFDYGTSSLVRDPYTNYAPYYFRAIAYHKGAWVLHMLRRQLGDSTFFAALRAYLDDPGLRFGNATSSDFQRICENVSGQNLQVFFDQWLYRTTYPVLQVDWRNEWLEGANQFSVRVQQLQDPEPDGTRPPYYIPIEVRLVGSGIDTTVTLVDYRLDQTFVLNLPANINWIAVDPDRWLLHSTTNLMNKSAHNVAQAPVKLLAPVPNPFNPRTAIRWESAVVTHDRLEIFDIHGRRILHRDLSEQPAGVREFSWLGQDDSGHAVPSGIYLYRLTVRGNTGVGDFSRQLKGRITLAR